MRSAERRRSTVLAAFCTALVVNAIAGASPLQASAAPRCAWLSDASGDYIDTLHARANRAKDDGRHADAARTLATLGTYEADCVERTIVDYRKGLPPAADDSERVRAMLWAAAALDLYDAAREARAAGDTAGRCRYARRAADAQRHIPQQPNPRREDAPLLRGC